MSLTPLLQTTRPEEIISSLTPICLEHKPLFDAYFRRYPGTLNMFSFGSMYLWGEERHHAFTEKEDHLIVSLQREGGNRQWYAPIGPEPARIITEVLPSSAGFSWSYINEQLAAALPASLPLTWNRDKCDYIYSVPELRELLGKKFSNKRNHIRHFYKLAEASNQTVRIIPIDTSTTDDCLRVYEEWAARKKLIMSEKDYHEVMEDRHAFQRAMTHFDALHLRGIGIVINDRLEAFAIGEELNTTTVGLWFSKALDTHHELLTLTIHEFIKSLQPQYLLLNRAIDGGLPGLRTSKEGWHPVELAKNYSSAF